MGATCSVCTEEEGYKRTGRWDPKSMSSNRRLLQDEQSYADLYDDDREDSQEYVLDDDMEIGIVMETSMSEQEIEAVRCAFMDAIQSGNDSLGRYLDGEHPDLELLQTIFPNGDLSLHQAVRLADHKLMLYLLTNGLSVEYKPNDPNLETLDTSLHLGVMAQSARVVAILLNYNADPSIKNNDGKTPLELAEQREDHHIAEMLSAEVQKIMRERQTLEVPASGQSKRASLTIGRALPDDELRKKMKEDDVDEDELMDEAPTLADLDNDTHRSMPLHELYGVDRSGMSLHEQRSLRLSAQEQIALEKQKMANKNPFGGLKRQNTNALLSDMVAVSDANEKTPDLEGWLKQRMPSGKWEERYIIVKGAHILWNDTKIEIDDDRDRNQRRKFRNEYNLLSVEKIESIDSRSQQKFKFQIGTSVRSKKTLVFIWKSDNKKSRDKWVESLQQKKELLTAFHDYLVE